VKTKITLRLEFDRRIKNEVARIKRVNGATSSNDPKRLGVVTMVTELHGINRRTVVAAVFNLYRPKLVPRDKLVGVEIVVSEDAARRIEYLFKKMATLPNPIPATPELAALVDQPTSLDAIEGFVGRIKLLRGTVRR
jgi:hypothetical protein